VIALYRIDDRLIHGQVVLGWGQALRASFIVLVDDAVAASGWEQDLYRMGVPPGIEVYFAGVDEAAAKHAGWLEDKRHGILLTPDVQTMARLTRATTGITKVNIGGIHHRAGRVQKLRYVYLTAEDEAQIVALAESGVEIAAQDVPASRPVALGELLEQDGAG